MARKQARRRKETPKIRLPKISVAQILTPLAAIAVIGLTYHVSTRMLDRDIASLEISGPFQRVTPLQIEEALAAELDAGFFGADLGDMQRRIQALPWIDQAAVARRWPDRIAITVTEQVPAAIWGDRGLLNVRGELFVAEAQHLPAELPRLSGPADSSADVARRYLHVRDQLVPLGLDLRQVQLDRRGAWDMTPFNSVEVRLGRRDVDRRTDLFIAVVADVITGQAGDIKYVDMRYSNGFSIGTKDGANGPGEDSESTDREMLAATGAQRLTEGTQ